MSVNSVRHSASFDLPDAQSYGGTIGGLGQSLKAGAGQLTLTGKQRLERRHDDHRRHAPFG